MGSTPSHPIIDFNSASLGKHNNILLPPEAFPAPYPARGRYIGNKYVKGYPVPYRWPRNLPVEVDGWKGGGKRGGRRKVGGRYGDKGVGGVGMGMGGVPMVPVPVQVPVYYDARGVKAMSAPNLYGVRGKGRQVVQPQGQAQVRPQMVPTPGVGPVPGQAGGMPYGYAYPPPPAAPRHQSTTQLPPPLPHGVPQSQPQNQRLNPGIPDVPYGARIARPTSPARRASSQNRTQPRGPPANEWLEGSNPWLDACTCTTNCRCRKGARVLYRAEGKGGDRREGEIRYVVRDEVGRDCGDHRCREEESDGGRGKRKKKKEGSGQSSEVGRIREEMEGLRRDIERMRVSAGMGAAPLDLDPRFNLGPPQGEPFPAHPDALSGLDPRLDPSPFPPPRRNPTRRPPRPRHRLPDLSDDMEFPAEEHFFPPQPQAHRRLNRRPRPPFNPPPLRQRRNARPPSNYPPIDSPISHRFSAPDEDEEEDWGTGSPLGGSFLPFSPPFSSPSLFSF